MFQEKGPRGLYKGSCGSLELRDAFRWFNFSVKVHGEAEIVLIPIHELNPFMEIDSKTTGQTSTSSGRPRILEDRFDARPYYPGDDIRHINWKLLAHSGQLILRTEESTPPPHDEITIVFDPWVSSRNEWALYLLDKGINALANCLSYCELKMHPLHIFFPDGTWTTGEDTGKLRKLMAGVFPCAPTSWKPELWPEYTLIFGDPSSPNFNHHLSLLSRKNTQWVIPSEWEKA